MYRGLLRPPLQSAVTRSPPPTLLDASTVRSTQLLLASDLDEFPACAVCPSLWVYSPLGTRTAMALSATRGLRCKPSATMNLSLGPSLHPWPPPDGQRKRREHAGIHTPAAVTPPGSADFNTVLPTDPLTRKVPSSDTGFPAREAAPLLLKDRTEDATSTCASAVHCGCSVL